MATCSNNVCGTGRVWTDCYFAGDPDNNSVLVAISEFGGIRLWWTMPTVNAHAVAHTRIFRNTESNLRAATEIATASGNQYFDVSSADVIQTYYYWIQHVSINGTVLAPIGPAWAIPKPAIDGVIEDLTNRIETSHLATQLRSHRDYFKSGIGHHSNQRHHLSRKRYPHPGVASAAG